MIRLAEAIDEEYMSDLLRHSRDKNYVRTEIVYLAKKEINDADVDPSRCQFRVKRRPRCVLVNAKNLY